MRRTAISGFLLSVVLACAISAAPGASTGLYVATGVTLAIDATLFYAIRRLRIPGRGWSAFAMGGALCAVASLAVAADLPVAPILYLLGYSIAGVGGWRYLKDARQIQHGGDLRDAAIIAVAAAATINLVAYGPAAAKFDADPAVYWAAVGFLSLATLVIAFVARVGLLSGLSNVSHRFTALMGLSLVLIDVLASLSEMGAMVSVPPGLLIIPHAAGLAAVVHPSARQEPLLSLETSGLAASRVLLRQLAMGLLPTAFILATVGGLGPRAIDLAVGSLLVTAVVAWRLRQLVAEQRELNHDDQIIHQTGVALLAAEDHDHTDDAWANTLIVESTAALLHVDPSRIKLFQGDEIAPTDRLLKANKAHPVLAGAIYVEAPDTQLRALANADEGDDVVFIEASDRRRMGVLASGKQIVRPMAIRSSTMMLREAEWAIESSALRRQVAEQRSNRRFQALIEQSLDIVAVLDEGGRFHYVSPAMGSVLGHDSDSLIGVEVATLGLPDQQQQLGESFRALASTTFEPRSAEIQVLHADGTPRTLQASVTDHRSRPEISGIVLNARDISVERNLEHDLVHQATHDELTGLPNRFAFGKRVDAAAASNGGWGQIGVLVIDLDDFKSVNDTLGHDVGDELLGSIAERLGQLVRVSDGIARIGGDEFGVLLKDLTSEDEAVAVAERVLEIVGEPVTLNGREVTPAVSIGAAFGWPSQIDGKRLLRNADSAMNQAKSEGKGRLSVFDQTLYANTVDRFELKSALVGAIGRGEFHLVHQPLVDLRTGDVRGVEALLRWTHPERGLVPPDAFIPLAEETGLILELGRWVLSEAIGTLAKWKALPNASNLSMSVNLSVRQLEDDNVAAFVEQLMAEHSIDPGDLHLEITESVALEAGGRAAQQLDALRCLGTPIAIDDFGTGYSSLQAVQGTGFDILKIDRSFVTPLDTDPEDVHVVRSIIDLARGMDAETVGEGIETQAELQALIAIGCDIGQGWIFSKPLLAQDLVVLMASGGFGDIVHCPKAAVGPNQL